MHAPRSQVESGLAVQQLKPTIDLIKRRYGDDKARIQKETAALYEKTGVNPLAGKLNKLPSNLAPIGLACGKCSIMVLRASPPWFSPAQF